METRRNVNINSVEIIWLCARSCKTPSWEHHTARMFIRKFSSSQHRHRTNVGKPWHKEASYPFHRKGSLLLPQPKPANDVSASHVWVEGPSNVYIAILASFAFYFPFFLAVQYISWEGFGIHCVSQETPVQTATGYLWAAGHRKRDVAVKHMWRHLTGRNWGSSKDESMQAFEFLAVFTAHIEVILYKHDCHHSLQCQNLLRDHLIG